MKLRKLLNQWRFRHKLNIIYNEQKYQFTNQDISGFRGNGTIEIVDKPNCQTQSLNGDFKGLHFYKAEIDCMPFDGNGMYINGYNLKTLIDRKKTANT